MSATATERIQKTPGVCGGDARIGNQRITVWHLVLAQKMGRSDAAILDDYPSLTPDDLDACWDYYRENALEIERDIWLNDTSAHQTATGRAPEWAIVSGLLLGIPESEVREAFDVPVSARDIADAWAAYRADPAGVERAIAGHPRRA